MLSNTERPKCYRAAVEATEANHTSSNDAKHRVGVGLLQQHLRRINARCVIQSFTPTSKTMEPAPHDDAAEAIVHEKPIDRSPLVPRMLGTMMPTNRLCASFGLASLKVIFLTRSDEQDADSEAVIADIRRLSCRARVHANRISTLSDHGTMPAALEHILLRLGFAQTSGFAVALTLAYCGVYHRSARRRAAGTGQTRCRAHFREMFRWGEIDKEKSESALRIFLSRKVDQNQKSSRALAA